MKHAQRRLMIPVGIAGAAALALTGCVGDSDPSNGGGTGGEAADCSAYEEYGTHEGTSVSIYGTILDLEADRLNESWADFESCTGIDVVYEGSGEFEAQINVRVQGGNPPNLAIFPQPGLLASVAGTGSLLPAPDSVKANAEEFWTEDWVNYGTVDDTFYAAPLMASIKGYIWYSPSMFADNGWEIPTTLDELDTLTADIAAADGDVMPWCAGFGSADATGWPGTDWVEDYMLRLHGPDVYDQWVNHEIPFNDPRVAEAMDRVGDILKNDDYVNGGFGNSSTIVGTDFGDGGLPIVDGACAMHHQASFYEGFWPEGTEVSEDGDIWAFLTPAVEAGGGAEVTGGGEFVGAFSDAPEVQAFQTFLSSDEWANLRVSLGGVVSANNGLDTSNASSILLEQAAETLQDPETLFRFDGSDVMPAAVGTGSFWKAINDWMGGAETQTVLDAVENSWP
ncbi:ABC transporter substrate-binding protein [Humidisolicoccus flavus]|uniref:ABC transporter substrate-binding protein n=1 Tax=Humidisolicoccus flavus TaxID=3111414 RepID=UPI003251C76E